MDRHTKEQRRKNMQAIKAADSRIEIRLRKELFKLGYRYRKNYKKVIGKPDIAFVKKKVAIFCDSEFWHGKNWNIRKKDFKSNKKFWLKKIQNNIDRDKYVNKVLRKEGWRVLRFWGSDINKKLDFCINKIEKELAKR